MSSDRYQAFFTSSPVGMGWLDLDGRFVEVNQALCQLLGYSAQDLVSCPLEEFIASEKIATYRQTLQQLLLEATPTICLEQPLRQSHGDSYWVLMRLVLLHDSKTHQPSYIAATFEDIDQRKQLETNLRKQVKQNSLLVNFTRQMLRTFDLKEVLQFSVNAVRHYLQVDRVVIYRFDTALIRDAPINKPPKSGKVIVEAVGPEWQSLLDQEITDSCLMREDCLRAYQRGQVRAISNIYTAGYASCSVDWLAELQVVSSLTLAIAQDERLWGLLVIHQCSGERVWQLDDIKLAKKIVAQMAIAIKQSELYTQTQLEAFRQEALNDLSRTILSAQNLDTFFSLALPKFLEVFQADQVVIAQYRPESARWLLIAEAQRTNILDGLLGEELVFSPTLFWQDASPSNPIVTTTLEQLTLSENAAVARLFSEPWVIVPLVIQAGLWGGLMIVRYDQKMTYWDQSKLDLVELMSRQLSLAIQQNLFYKHWQRQAEQQTGLHRLINAIRDSLDLDEIFDRAASEVRGLIQVERVLIWEFNPNQRIWTVRVDERSGDDIPNFIGLELPDDHNSLTQALKHGSSLRYPRGHVSSEELVQVLSKTFPGAWLWVPLRVSQMTWGALHCVQKDDWQDWQQEVAHAVADKLAIAVQQSLLYEQVQAANYKLLEMALIDGLTQIPNRRYFDDYLAQEWARMVRESNCLSLILCDVDFFKAYNDTYGHQQGDLALKAIAKTLKQTIHRPGDVVARYGGEEFGIILPATTSIGAARIADNIQAAIHQRAIPHPDSDASQYVTLSLGIASLYPQAQLSPQHLLALADRALYRAKRQGRNQFCIHAHNSD